MVRNGLPSGVLKISVLNVIGLLLLALVSEPVFLRARSLGGSLRWTCPETREVTPKYKQYMTAPYSTCPTRTLHEHLQSSVNSSPE